VSCLGKKLIFGTLHSAESQRSNFWGPPVKPHYYPIYQSISAFIYKDERNFLWHALWLQLNCSVFFIIQLY